MLDVPIHPLELAGIGFTVALMALAWAWRDRLHAFGLEFLAWRKTSTRENVKAVAVGACCGLAISFSFHGRYSHAAFHWQDAWIGITLGPLLEEAVFRGYLFGLLTWGLRRRVPYVNVLAGLVIAAAFAISHLSKQGITPLQIGAIFLMGLVYAWLRIRSKSTTSPVLAHSAYNAVIFAAATLVGA